jgi:predicted small secreted protein
MKFPDRVYTTSEVKKARELIQRGYKHNLEVEGTPDFKLKIDQILELTKTASYYEFLRTYIRKIVEIDGLTQLRETEVAIWANKFAIENPVDGASFVIQKAYTMKEYIDGHVYYGGLAEKRSIDKRLEFLASLRNKTQDENVKTECERLLKMWEESSVAY